jgi:hypothetical protein
MPPGLRVAAVEKLEQATSTASGARRTVIASVRVRELATNAVYPLDYRLDVNRRDGRWYVAAVAGGLGA